MKVLVYNKIEELAKKRKISIRKLCDKAEITDSAYHNGKGNFALKVKTIMKFADILKVSPAYFFEDNGDTEYQQAKDKPGDSEKTERVGLEREAELLKELIREKDKRLKLLEEKYNPY